jgi:hypothetical protein
MNIDIKIPPPTHNRQRAWCEISVLHQQNAGEKIERKKKNSIFLSGNKISFEGISVWGK